MSIASAVASRSLAVATVLWLVLLGFASWNGTRASPGLPSSVSTAGIYAFSAAICHQQPERSFHYRGAQLPVCARCFGIYAGAGLIAAAALAGSAPRAASFGLARRLFFASVLANLLTLASEWAGGPHSNSVRAAAGVLLGASAVWAILALFRLPESVEVN